MRVTTLHTEFAVNTIYDINFKEQVLKWTSLDFGVFEIKRYSDKQPCHITTKGIFVQECDAIRYAKEQGKKLKKINCTEFSLEVIKLSSNKLSYIIGHAPHLGYYEANSRQKTKK